jgi:hypothetical protein
LARAGRGRGKIGGKIRRFQGLEVEERSRFNALERRVHELEAAQAQGDRDRPDEDAPSPVRILLPPAPAPAKKHAVYMRAWRRKKAALRPRPY